MNHDWLFKKVEDLSGRVQTIVYFNGINTVDFIDEFGEPHKIDNKNGRDKTFYWNFILFNGIKFTVYFDSGDYVFKKMRRLDLKKHGPVEMSDVDLITIMGDPNALPLLRMYFIKIFNVDNIGFDKYKAFDFLFIEEKWRR